MGTKLLGWTHVGYVEYNDHCQRVIRQRILDGILENAPIFGDIRSFIDEGYAASYQGLVDVVTAGFPCQGHSLAGKRLGEHDERNMWPETLEVIRTVKPRYAFLENVPGLLSSNAGEEPENVDDRASRSVGYFGTILADLAESGFDVRWRVLSAAEVGAPHKRDRLFISCSNAEYFTREISVLSKGHGSETKNRDASEWCENRDRFKLVSELGSISSQWDNKPDIPRMVNGVADWLDRLKAIGNGQVPICAAAAWKLLS